MCEKDFLSKGRDYEFYCFGTSRIFEKRAQKLKTLRTWITFLGIVTPVIVGGAVLSFGSDKNILPYFLFIAGVVGLVQLTLSTWAIVARWDERYEYAVDALRVNTDLYNKWKSYCEIDPENKKLFKTLQSEYEIQEIKDIGQTISDKEKRFANRESLKYYKKECHLCNSIPITSKPEKCDGCGNY